MLLPETLKLHDRDRFEFHYIYFLPWKNQMVRSIEEAGGKVICLSARNNLQLIFRTGSVIAYAKRHQIQVIHCHLPWAGIVGRIVHVVTGIPLLYTEHNKQERYHFATRLLNRLTFAWQTGVIAVSKDVADSIKKSIKARVPIYEILNGVNTVSFVRNEELGLKVRLELGIPSDACVVGTVAVFRFQKRIREWLQVFATAASQQANMYAIIVGDGPLKEEIFQTRKELQLESRVFMPGLQTEVKPWLSAMDIFMMTSVFEGLPVAMLEAMSMECAIVSTNAGGIQELIRDKVDGFVVAVDSYMELAAIISGLHDRSACRSMGKHARQRVMERFSLAQMVHQLEERYRAANA